MAARFAVCWNRRDSWVVIRGSYFKHLLEGNGMGVQNYRQLDVWNVSMELAEAIYRLTATMPPDERFGLTAQMRRAVVSIPSNIAEGSARTGSKEFLHHLSIARGSLMELETQLALAARLQLLPRVSALKAWDLCERISKMLNKLRFALRKKVPH